MTTAERLFNEAQECDQNKDYEQAFTLYLAAAELGYAPALANVGYAYLYGEGTEKDYDKAVEFLRKAADGGNVAAITNLGLCYSKGYGVAMDKRKALELYKQAADAGSETAKRNYENLLKEQNDQPPKPVNIRDVKVNPAPYKPTVTEPTSDDFNAFYDKVRQSAPCEGHIFLYGVKEKYPHSLQMGANILFSNPSDPVWLQMGADIVLSGPEDAVTVLPVRIPEYGIDIRMAVPNGLKAFEMITIKNVPSPHSPVKPYNISIMPAKVQRRRNSLYDDTQENVRIAQQLVQYYKANHTEPEQVNAMRLYGPVETEPRKLLVAVELSFEGVAGTVVPIKLPKNNVEVQLGCYYKLQENIPFVISDLTDGSGNSIELTVVPVKISHKTKDSGNYELKKIAREYVDKLIHMQLGNSEQLRSLEDRGLLEQAAVELYVGSTYDIGDKAKISEHFLFHKSKSGFIIPCQDILWFYDTWKGDFYVGTRYNGVVKISSSRKTSRKYPQILSDVIHSLQQRTENLLVGNTLENEAEYERRASIR